MVEGGAASEQGAVGAAAKQSSAGDDASAAWRREMVLHVAVGRAQGQSQGLSLIHI